MPGWLHGSATGWGCKELKYILIGCLGVNINTPPILWVCLDWHCTKTHPPLLWEAAAGANLWPSQIWLYLCAQQWLCHQDLHLQKLTDQPFVQCRSAWVYAVICSVCAIELRTMKEGSVRTSGRKQSRCGPVSTAPRSRASLMASCPMTAARG